MAGTDGNLIQLKTTATNTAVSGTVLSGGATTVDGQSEVINFGFQANFTTVNVIVNNI
jgi:ABC-type phosphate transport system substrate-binding protein